MPFQKRGLLLAFLLASASAIGNADVVADSLFSFPAQTEYLEYDDLTALRRLPNYNALRDNFSGKTLEEVKAVLGTLGVQEDQVQQVVTGSTSTVFYGLVAGAFSGESIAKDPKRKRYAARLLDTHVFCTGRGMCIVFLEDSLAAFGSVAELKKILLVRQGVVTRLSSNNDAVQLINGTERTAPVRGMLFGEQLRTAVSTALHDWSGWKMEGSRLTATISGVGYSVTFDTKAHVSATLQCASRTTAAMLAQMLSAAGALQSVAGPVVSTAVGLPFQKMQVSSSGNSIHFQAEAVIPAAKVGGGLRPDV